MKKRIISIIVLIIILSSIIPYKSVSASDNIKLIKTEYNIETACWEFTIKSNNNKKIYYTYKDSEELNENCEFIKSGEKVSIPSSLIKNSYKVLKVATYNKKSISKMYFNTNSIARNTYINDLTKLCAKLS